MWQLRSSYLVTWSEQTSGKENGWPWFPSQVNSEHQSVNTCLFWVGHQLAFQLCKPTSSPWFSGEPPARWGSCPAHRRPWKTLPDPWWATHHPDRREWRTSMKQFTAWRPVLTFLNPALAPTERSISYLPLLIETQVLKDHLNLKTLLILVKQIKFHRRRHWVTGSMYNVCKYLVKGMFSLNERTFKWERGRRAHSCQWTCVLVFSVDSHWQVGFVSSHGNLPAVGQAGMLGFMWRESQGIDFKRHVWGLKYRVRMRT